MLFFALPHRVTSCFLEGSQQTVEETDVCLLSCRLSMGKEKKKLKEKEEKTIASWSV